jgi:hypothetical protein
MAGFAYRPTFGAGGGGGGGFAPSGSKADRQLQKVRREVVVRARACWRRARPRPLPHFAPLPRPTSQDLSALLGLDAAAAGDGGGAHQVAGGGAVDSTSFARAATATSTTTTTRRWAPAFGAAAAPSFGAPLALAAVG